MVGYTSQRKKDVTGAVAIVVTLIARLLTVGVPVTMFSSAFKLPRGSWQVLTWVRVPLAIPVIMAGIRTAAVINVGTATLAAFVGGGGLGDPIVAGLALADSRMVLSGAIPAAALAVLVDVSLAGVQHALTPGALRERLASGGSS